ncbi:DUF6461 domain-containing protein [Streptacidiphilus sp. MAP12-16]|uniref:DUF6461 domain-containing protein n=1 Tax=Streptacidiphilus sp. MAP12-16 TaxID=3156300 RepID=UPI0035194221
MMTATAADYLWFQQRFPELASAYCITLVRDVAPAELLHRLDGQEQPTVTSLDAIVRAAVALGDSRRGADQLVAMTRVGSWTLMIEPNGSLGVTEEIAGPASTGTRWVSHYHRVNDVDTFLDYTDTAMQTIFESPVSEHGLGGTPAEITASLQEMGFNFGDPLPETDLSAPAAFALAEVLTGVKLTPNLLDQATFYCGTCPPPPVRRVWPAELTS